MRYLPPSCCFYKGRQSPLDQSWWIGEGLRGKEAGLLPHLLHAPATSGGSRTFLTSRGATDGSVALSPHCRTLHRPPGQDWIQTSPLLLSLPCLCFFFSLSFLGGEGDGSTGQTYRRLVLLRRKARWIYKTTKLGRGDLSPKRRKRGGGFYPS